MATMETAAHATCRVTKCHVEPYRNCAMIDEALWRMSTPNETITSTVAKRIQSVLSLCAISVLRLQLVDEMLENFASVFVTSELVEAGTRRGQQNRIARTRFGICVRYRLVHCFGINQRRRSLELFGNFGGRRANQQRRSRLSRERLAQ